MQEVAVADQGTIDRVGQKFQEWAGSLPGDEQEALAEWWGRASGDEVQGFGANWWQGENAWSNAWNAWWSE
jgi:hypothetical protein